MKLWKTVCALLACLVLVATQTFFISHAQANPSIEKKCACGSCEVMKCCVSSQPNPAPQQSTPAQTARGQSQIEVHFVATVIALLSEPALRSTAQPVPASFVSLSSTEVPLYTWNCSYLI